MNPPLSRYAGGKRHLLPQILALMPKEFEGIHEPFAGGAALFWSLTSPEKPMPAILVDKNPFVVALYRGLKENAEGVAIIVERLAEMEQLGGVDDLGILYKVVRETANQMAYGQTLYTSLAARTLYLNRRCFNGLMRVNRRGEFNVPMGKWKDAPPALPTRQEILDWGAALQNADIHSDVHVCPPEGWVYYADPPYWSGFTQYTAEGFGREDQVLAADLADAFSQNGAHVICSNSDTPEIRELYEERGFTIHEVSRPGTINSDGAKRARVGELLMVKEPR